MCVWRLLAPVNGQRRLEFHLLHCVSYALFRIGPTMSFRLVISQFQYFFFPKGVYLLFDEVIYINNKQCEKSADAVCYRITWKNNDERHQVLMRHLEMHIKRQPGVFLHSLGNWCLSLLPWASLQEWIAVIRLPTGKMIFFFPSFWALFDSFPINGRSLRWLQSTKNSSDHTKIYNCEQKLNYNSSWNTLAMRFVLPKYQETITEIGFYAAGCRKQLRHQQLSTSCDWERMLLLVCVGYLRWLELTASNTGLELHQRTGCTLAKIKYQF